MQSVAIIGVGLIGGSLGLVWKKQAQDVEIIGFDQPATLDRAIEIGALDRAASSLEEAISGADVIVLAAPIQSVLALLFWSTRRSSAAKSSWSRREMLRCIIRLRC